ncbi:WSC-domain-containing protein [Piedraia hortae CBS 480.64]|uniref:WSC-domain-containing protein n=1 Tax=Piedraia hortae CBS 480.64 TaxID=1314780 RepID=A0A6A7CB34_9PEZI|nr:WSC-domain-containing protein [Piedraia hortae CBS 480.64]
MLAALVVLLLSASSAAVRAHDALLQRHGLMKRQSMTYSGCYSSSGSLDDQGPYMYQTSGYCQPICLKKNNAVLGLSGGSDCWCGDTLPPANTKVDDSKCDSPCNGYGSDKCGGQGFYSVYLTGLKANVGNDKPMSGTTANNDGAAAPSPSSASTVASQAESSAGSSSSAATITGSTTDPSDSVTGPVVFRTDPPTTLVVTDTSTVSTPTAAAPPPKSSKGGGKSNTVGIAVGVVVGILALLALLVAFFLYRRHRKRQAEKAAAQTEKIKPFFAERDPNHIPPSTTITSRRDFDRDSIGSLVDEDRPITQPGRVLVVSLLFCVKRSALTGLAGCKSRSGMKACVTTS